MSESPAQSKKHGKPTGNHPGCFLPFDFFTRDLEHPFTSLSFLILPPLYSYRLFLSIVLSLKWLCKISGSGNRFSACFQMGCVPDCLASEICHPGFTFFCAQNSYGSRSQKQAVNQRRESHVHKMWQHNTDNSQMAEHDNGIIFRASGNNAFAQTLLR